MAQISSGIEHAIICADCRDGDAVKRLLRGRKATVVVTSPPYASQRKYDEASGFKPIPPDEYVQWYKDVAAVIWDNLADDGSYFLNIKENSEDGERNLYVKDLVLAHKRQWGWRFVDEFCWRNTANGVPGHWNNRFKNAWEPVFHFAKTAHIKFRPDAVSHASDDVVVYASSNRAAASGSGLLGAGARIEGMARPSNVIEAPAERRQVEHSAPFPVMLPEFFIKAFSDPGDAVFDPFLGSGSTMIAAMKSGRSCYGVELSPRYCDVIVMRGENQQGDSFRLDGDGRTFGEVQERTTNKSGVAAASDSESPAYA